MKVTIDFKDLKDVNIRKYVAMVAEKPDIFVEDGEDSVKIALLANKRIKRATVIRLLKDKSKEVRMHAIKHNVLFTEDLSEMVNDPSEMVRRELAKISKLNRGDFERLLKDPEEGVRIAALSNPQIKVQDVAEMAKDESHFVRFYVLEKAFELGLWNLIKIFLDDKNDHLRMKARLMLRRQ